jgi:hypothetical protein
MSCCFPWRGAHPDSEVHAERWRRVRVVDMKDGASPSGGSVSGERVQQSELGEAAAPRLREDAEPGDISAVVTLDEVVPSTGRATGSPGQNQEDWAPCPDAAYSGRGEPCSNLRSGGQPPSDAHSGRQSSRPGSTQLAVTVPAWRRDCRLVQPRADRSITVLALFEESDRPRDRPAVPINRVQPNSKWASG